MTQLFVDLDGVLADFNGAFEDFFGFRPGYGPDDRLICSTIWKEVHKHGSFFRDLRPLPDHRELWDGVAYLNPTILTGVAKSVPDVFEQKRAWVDEHIGQHVHVIGCYSKDKCKHAKAGDILIDDWERYRHLWEGMGGRWITHRSAKDSLAQLAEVLA